MGGSLYYNPFTKKNHDVKPIGAALEYLFSQLGQGDTVWINSSRIVGQPSEFDAVTKKLERFKLLECALPSPLQFALALNKKSNENQPDNNRRITRWMCEAISRGAQVKVMWINEKQNKFELDRIRNIRAALTAEQQQLLEFRKIEKWNHENVKIHRCHSKVYSFQYGGRSSDSDFKVPSTVFGIGTYNFDFQSYYGSAENMLFLDDNTNAVNQKWIVDMWQNAEKLGEPELSVSDTSTPMTVI